MLRNTKVEMLGRFWAVIERPASCGLGLEMICFAQEPKEGAWQRKSNGDGQTKTGTGRKRRLMVPEANFVFGSPTKSGTLIWGHILLERRWGSPL